MYHTLTTILLTKFLNLSMYELLPTYHFLKPSLCIKLSNFIYHCHTNSNLVWTPYFISLILAILQVGICISPQLSLREKCIQLFNMALFTATYLIVLRFTLSETKNLVLSTHSFSWNTFTNS